MAGGVRWRQVDAFGRAVQMSNTQWTHIIQRHGHDIGNRSVFENDVRSALPAPELVYRSESRDYSESEIFVGCSSDAEYEGYVVLVVVKAPESGAFVASAYIKAEVPGPGRTDGALVAGAPAMHPCGNPRPQIKQRINASAREALDALREQLEQDDA